MFASVFKNFVIFTGKHLCWSFFIKKRLQHRCCPVNIAKFYEQLFLLNTSDGCFYFYYCCEKSLDQKISF